MPELARRRDDEELLAEISRIISIVARRIWRSWRYLDRQELEAEAWRSCLAAVDGYDRTKGPAEAYFRVIARRAMGRFCSGTVAAVSMGKKVAMGAKFQKRAKLTGWTHEDIDWRYAELVGEGLGDDAERVALRAADDVEATERTQRARALIEEAIASWGEWEREVVYCLYGLDGRPQEKAMELAERLGVERRKVYKVRARLEKAVWSSLALYELHKSG